MLGYKKNDDGYSLVDKNSTNGVFLNDKRIYEHTLKHGDVFHIGETFFHFILTAEEDSVSGKMPYRRPQKVCPTCGNSTKSENNFCPACGTPLTPELQPPVDRREGSGRSTHGRVIAAIVVCALAAVSASALLAAYLLTSWRGEPSSSLTRMAPELAPYGDRATLQGEPRTFTADREGFQATLSDGAVIVVPHGVLGEPVRFQGAVFDLELPVQSADGTSAQVYMVATETSTGPLKEPVVLEIPVAVSANVTFAWYDGSDWLSFSVPEGPEARIQFHSFSRRYVAVVKGQKTSAPNPGATVTAGARLDILAPNRSPTITTVLNTYMNYFRQRGFNQVITLGNSSAVQKALKKDLTVEVDPSLSTMGKYTPRDARWFGILRNHLLQVRTMDVTNNFVGLKTVWHEFLHHMINLEGGEECGPEEAYMELVENRADWLGYLNTFDQYVNSVKVVDRTACDQIKRRWDKLSSLWESFNGNHLSGPFSWQDPGGDTCDVFDETYTVSSDFIKKWDKKLGIDINVEKLRSFYDNKVRSLPSSLSSGCDLRKVKPPPALPATQGSGAPPSILPGGGGDPQPCPVVEDRIQRCSWSPEGYAEKPCPPGYCFDSGPRGTFVCVQIDPVENGRRSYTRKIICNDGFTSVRDPCSNVILECVPN